MYAYSSSLKDAVDQHVEWLSVRQYSEGLRQRRKRHLADFVGWCEARGAQDFARVSRPLVERYQKWLFYFRKQNGKPLSVGMQYSRLESVKAFLKWATRLHLLEHNPAGDLEMPRLPDRIPRAILTAREVELILLQPDVRDPLGLRDRAMLETFYSTGIRRAEMRHLLRSDVDQERGTLMVREGKNRRDRLIPIGERAVQWIEQYLLEGRPQLVVEPDCHVMFLSKMGAALSLHTLSGLTRRYLESAAIQKPGSCHLFRHTMATAMMENGADIRFIQALLGHRHLDTTSIYTRVAIGKLKEVHTATHPAETKQSTGFTKEKTAEDAQLVERAAILARLLDEADEEEHSP